MATDRYRTFAVQRSYFYDTHDENRNLLINAPTEEEWKKQVVSEWSDLSGLGADWCIMVFHDDDINTDGTPKGLHAHCVIHFTDGHSQSAAVKNMGASCIQNCEPVRRSTVDAVRYLMHASESAFNEMKTPYPVTALMGWGLDEDGNPIELTLKQIQIRMSRPEEKRAGEQERKKVLDRYYAMVEAGKLMVLDVKEFYRKDPDHVGLVGRDFSKDREMYEEAFESWLEDVRHFYGGRESSRTNIYISGFGGLGKDDLAMDFANLVSDVHGVHLVPAKGNTTYDFAGLYKGERISVFSDTSSASFELRQFLNVLDPKRFNVVASRMKDKYFFPDYCVLTSSECLESFIYGLFKPYAAKNARLSPAVRRRLTGSTGITEQDWIQAYISSSPEIASLFAEIRRRFAVCVELTGKEAVIYYRSKIDCPVSFLYIQPTPGMEPFILFDRVPFDRKSPDFTDVHRPEAAQRIKDAVKAYYDYHGYKHPDDCEKPDFSSVLAQYED